MRLGKRRDMNESTYSPWLRDAVQAQEATMVIYDLNSIYLELRFTELLQ